MWYLSLKQTPGVGFMLLADRDYTIGRLNCDVVVADDPTVSRKHAQLKCCSNISSKLTLTDLSKYGTWVNNERVNGEREITSGDEVKFGSPKSVYTITYESFIVTSSCLDNASKMAVKSSLRQLGGQMINDWSEECRLLIMSNLSVTIKVVNTLVCQKHVVTPQYLCDYISAVIHSTTIPNPTKYLPPLAESQLNSNEVSFLPNPARRRLFTGLKFYFINPKQMKKLKITVELCGGDVHMLEQNDLSEDLLIREEAVVMQCDCEDRGLTDTSRHLAVRVADILKRHGKRAIADSEIGYAVLYCSTKRHCNPDIKPGGRAFSNLPSQTFSTQLHSVDQSEVLVQDTEVSPLRCSAPEGIPLPVIPDEESEPSKHKRQEPSRHQRPIQENLLALSQIKTEPLSMPDSNHWSADMETEIDLGETGGMGETVGIGETIKREIDSEQIDSAMDDVNSPSASSNVEQVMVIQQPEVGSVLDGNSASKCIKDDVNSKKMSKKIPKRRRHLEDFDSDSDDDMVGVVISKPPAKYGKTVENVSEDKLEDDHVQEQNAFGEAIGEAIEKTAGVGGVDIPMEDDGYKDERMDGLLFGVTKQEMVQDMDGFLNTHQLTEKKVVACETYEKQPDLPSACVQSKFVNLVARQQKSWPIETSRTDGQAMWKGELVKNFKMFKKSHYVGANQLPRIIGGRDLEVHTNATHINIEEMFHVEREAESQHSRESRLADAMFEMSFKDKVKKTRR